ELVEGRTSPVRVSRESLKRLADLCASPLLFTGHQTGFSYCTALRVAAPSPSLDLAHRPQAAADEIADGLALGEGIARVEAVLQGVLAASGRTDAGRAAMPAAASLAQNRRARAGRAVDAARAAELSRRIRRSHRQMSSAHLLGLGPHAHLAVLERAFV